MLVTLDADAAVDCGSAMSRDHCRQLEAGNILFWPCSPVEPSADDREFLLRLDAAFAGTQKNIAYMPRRNRVTGVAKLGPMERERLRGILRTHAEGVTRLVTGLLRPYADQLRVDYTSFRPIEEAGRGLAQRSRNDLLHVDAFPARPTNGDRILRVFTNLHPTQPRRWITTEGFAVLVRRFAGVPSLRLSSLQHPSVWQHGMDALRSAAGTGAMARSPYDRFMLRFHDFLKANAAFQADCPKEAHAFPPHSTWMLFTDMVPHAALSGQYALEQTFIMARAAMLAPERAPVTILEALCGRRLTLPAWPQPASARG